LLSSGPAPTAIICVNDVMAVGALKELRERGMRVPTDVSVTGFDNIKLSEYCHPALTTVHIPRDQIGHTVFSSLAPDSDAGMLGKEFIINPEFVLRDSSGPAPKNRR
jgi:DNA-binding LacI/PurR family transcriptional regulator